MKLSVTTVLLTICIIYAPADGRIEPNIALKFDSDVLMRAMGVPLCVRKCIDPFLDQLGKLWHMQNVVDNLIPLCGRHAEASECLRMSPGCDPYNLFKVASSSVEKMCRDRRPMFEKMRPCLTRHSDATAQICDRRCHGRANLTAFVNHPIIQKAAQMGGNILAVNSQLGGLCSSLNCEVACLTTELNKVCPQSGWLAMDVILHPMETVADLLLEASPTLKDFIANKMDKRCRFILQKSELLKMRKGQFKNF